MSELLAGMSHCAFRPGRSSSHWTMADQVLLLGKSVIETGAQHCRISDAIATATHI
jgi:hypothetical protein